MADQTGLWLDRFAGLARLESAVKHRLTADSTIVTAPAGSLLFGPGKSPENVVFAGWHSAGPAGVRNGPLIVLYRINAGESCVLSTASLLSYEDYAADGIAETDVRAAAVPRTVFDDLVARSKPFRDFVFAAFAKRLTDLFLIIDEVAFQRRGQLQILMPSQLQQLADHNT